jgi:hypothetical protein
MSSDSYFVRKNVLLSCVGVAYLVKAAISGLESCGFILGKRHLDFSVH